MTVKWQAGDTVYFMGKQHSDLYGKPAIVKEAGIMELDVNHWGAKTEYLSVVFKHETKERLITARRFHQPTFVRQPQPLVA